MAVKLRLKRMGAKKKPTYRIVATDSRRPRDGKYIELIGTYAPLNEDSVKINEEVALKWLNNGAIPTDTVKNLFSKAGIIKKYTAKYYDGILFNYKNISSFRPKLNFHYPSSFLF